MFFIGPHRLRACLKVSQIPKLHFSTFIIKASMTSCKISIPTILNYVPVSSEISTHLHLHLWFEGLLSDVPYPETQVLARFHHGILVPPSDPCDHIPINLPHPCLLPGLYVPGACRLIPGATGELARLGSQGSHTHLMPSEGPLFFDRGRPGLITS